MVKEFSKKVSDLYGDGHTYFVKLDLSSQKLHVDMEEEVREMIGDTVIERFDPIYPSLPKYEGRDIFASLSLISLKAKSVDDRIYATVEHLCQNEPGGKKALFTGILEHLKSQNAGSSHCAALIQAALELGGGNFDNKSLPLAERANIVKSKKIRKAFLEDDKKSKPIGFYTWRSELEKIFLQDRLLQEELFKEDASLLADTLHAYPKLRELYENYLAFIARLTNPLAKPTVLECEKPEFDSFSIVPPSSSPESELIKKLYSNTSIPEDFDLISEVIDRIKNKKLSLKPTEQSGWYDYQLYSFEPLIVPEINRESEKISWGSRYRDYLETLFRSLYALTRETHIKQLESPVCGGAPMPELLISPDLSIEPLPEYYLRRAESYRFIKQVLLDYFGEPTLSGAHLISSSSGEILEGGATLLNALLETESLFFGLYQISCREIGLVPQLSERAENEAMRDRAYAAKWIRCMADDEDIGIDCRCMVPLFYDRERRKNKVLVVIGFITRRLEIGYEEKPDITVTLQDKDVTGQIEPRWIMQRASVYFPVTREIYVDKLLNREEFREICDRYKTEGEIIKALEKM